MKEIIGWILVSISTIGALYTIALIISYALLPKDINDYYDPDIECGCARCEKQNNRNE